MYGRNILGVKTLLAGDSPRTRVLITDLGRGLKSFISNLGREILEFVSVSHI